MTDTSAARCAFCQIVSGTADASFVHRDDRVTAFLDIRPVTPGHLLVVPNDHAVSDGGRHRRRPHQRGE